MWTGNVKVIGVVMWSACGRVGMSIGMWDSSTGVDVRDEGGIGFVRHGQTDVDSSGGGLVAESAPQTFDVVACVRE
jgi:hypothetical protein